MSRITEGAAIGNGGDGVSVPPMLSQAAALTGPVLQCGAAGPGLYFGAGTPETFVSAQVGSLYLNSTGTSANTTAYVKRTGAGTNTGWFPITA